MRVNVYSEEMTEDVEIVEKEINGQTFTGVRFYLKSPEELHKNENDDDRSAVTFWGKKDLHTVLYRALVLLGNHHSDKKLREKSVPGPIPSSMKGFNLGDLSNV